MHAFLDAQKCIAFAHRGGALEAAENTMEAFEYAIGLGYRYIETDVQLTSDGVVVVFHDDDLVRLCSQLGSISDFTWDEVKKIQVLGQGTIPRFEDVLSAWPDINFNVDAKNDLVAGPLVEVAKSDNLERLCLASEFEKRIDFIRDQFGPDLCTAASRGEILRFVLPTLIGLKPGEIKAHCLQIPTKAFGIPLTTPAILGHAVCAEKAVHIWTIDAKEEMALLADKGVGGIMSDRPAVLKSVLESLHLW